MNDSIPKIMIGADLAHAVCDESSSKVHPVYREAFEAIFKANETMFGAPSTDFLQGFLSGIMYIGSTIGGKRNTTAATTLFVADLATLAAEKYIKSVEEELGGN